MSIGSNAITEFTGPAAGVGALAIGAGQSGLPFGADHRGTPVTLQAFRPRPTRLVLVDHGWVERIMILRALALGARVVIHTPVPDRWAGFGQAMTNTPDRVVAVAPDRPVHASATATEPLLHVIEGQQPLEPPRLGPWQAQVTVAPVLGEYLTAPILEADLLILQRLSRREMSVASSVLPLDQADQAALRSAPDGGLVMFSRTSKRYVMLTPTAVEQRIFGPPGAV